MNSTEISSFEFVEDNDRFDQLCEKWQSASCLALDTEFIRTNTFYSRLGLLQIADSDAFYLVDPLKIKQWSAFIALLKNPSCTFVIHSCSEDLNLLQTFLGCVPESLFDTQLAAAFLDRGYSISYQGLVMGALGIEVAKDETRSDWLQRPLTSKQLDYAVNDVRYLLELKTLLESDLLNKGMLEWFKTESQTRLDLAIKSENPKNWELFYTDISNSWRLNDKGLRALQKLCIWRETEARRRNKPRNWIVKDSDLSSIATAASNTSELNVETLMMMPKVDRKFMARFGSALVELLVDDSETEDVGVDRQQLKTPLSPHYRKKLKACQRLVEAEAEARSIAPELLARKKQLLTLVREHEQTGQLLWSGDMAGWRRQLLESKIVPLFETTESNSEARGEHDA